MGEFVRVATTDEIEPGTGKLVRANDLDIAIFNVGGRFCASGAVCPHEGGPLEEGTLDGDVVICPWHGYDFDLKTGACLVDSDLNVPVYPVKVEGNEIFVQTP